MKDKIALFVSYFLPRKVKMYAMLDWLDWMIEGVMVIEDPKYTIQIEKKLND